jgi:hypothetical protein
MASKLWRKCICIEKDKFFLDLSISRIKWP